MTTTLLTCLLSLLPPQDPPPRSTTMLPLQPLCGREHDRTPPPPWGSLLRYVNRDERMVRLLDSEDYGHVSPDSVADAIYSFEHEALDDGRLFLDALGNNLLVLGEDEAVKRVQRYIGEATQIVARPIEVEFALWDAADRETPPGVLDAAGYARFARNRSPIWRTTATGRDGDVLPLEHLTWTRYVRALEVEVAQKQTLSRPVTDHYGTGGQASVRACSLIAADDFALQVQFAVAQERGIRRTLQTGLPGAADIEVPRLESYFGACSGRVANGGALCATMRGAAAGGGQVMVTVRVTSRVPPATMSNQGVALLPCGALTNTALSQRVAIPTPMEYAESPVDYEDARSYGVIPADVLVNMAESVLSEDENAENNSVRCDGDHLYVRGTPVTVAAVEKLVRGLQEQLVRNVEIKHVASLDPESNEQDAAAPARATLHELVLPSLLGREAAACRLLESNVLANVYCEIAQEASILSPTVELLQSGAWLRARCTPVGEGLHLDVDVQATNAPVPPTRIVQPGGGMLMQAETALTRLRHDSIVASGQQIAHGNGPRISIDGRTFDSTMTTSASR